MASNFLPALVGVNSPMTARDAEQPAHRALIPHAGVAAMAHGIAESRHRFLIQSLGDLARPAARDVLAKNPLQDLAPIFVDGEHGIVPCELVTRPLDIERSRDAGRHDSLIRRRALANSTPR